jgi:putative ABC transport system permease protein
MIWRLAYRNLARNKRRTLSTGLAICVGFVGMNLLGAYLYRTSYVIKITSTYLGLLGHFEIYKKGGIEGVQVKPKKFLLQKSEQDEIAQKIFTPLKEEIEYTGSALSSAALLSNGIKSHPVVVIGIDPEAYVKSMHQPVVLKDASDWIRPWQRDNADMFMKIPDLIAITPAIAEIMSFKMPLSNSDSVQMAARSLDGDLNAINATLGAEHMEGSRFLEETIVRMPLAKVQELLATDGVASFSIFLNQGVNADHFEKLLREKAKSLSFETDIYKYTDEAVNSVYQGTMSFLYVMIFFFVLLICSAVSLTIVNALTMGIIERTREIGTLRAIGFTPKIVRQVFSCESLLISAFAMIAGTFFSFLITTGVNAAGIQFQPPGVGSYIDFKLVWNLGIALASAVILTLVTWGSAQVIIRRKSKTKLILLLHDIGESE